jgi:uncharacterized Zn-binding protein involved in type VI secretion
MNAARLSDSFYGICFCHTRPRAVYGTIITGSQDTFVNGLFAARLGDTVVGTCGHTGTIVSGSNNSFVNGLPQARLGDAVAGCLNGVIISGSPDTFVG